MLCEVSVAFSCIQLQRAIFGFIITQLTLFDVVSLCRRRGRGKRRHRYAVIDEDDDDKLESMEMLPKGGKPIERFVSLVAVSVLLSLTLVFL